MKWQKMATVRGQTLVEVVVVTGMVMLVLVAVVAGLSMSVANNRMAKDRAVAIRYAQEAVEWLRGWRDTIGWQALVDTLGSGSEIGYCVNALAQTQEALVALSEGVCGTGRIVGTDYGRMMYVSVAADRMTVRVVVDWFSSGQTRSAELTHTLHRGAQ